MKISEKGIPGRAQHAERFQGRTLLGASEKQPRASCGWNVPKLPPNTLPLLALPGKARTRDPEM